MRVSVYSIYAVALGIAVVAAVLSAVVLGDTFDAQQRQRVVSQTATGVGQCSSVQSLVQNQLARMQTATDANLRQFLTKVRPLPPAAFAPDTVIPQLNDTMFYDWIGQISTAGQLFGYGLVFMYPVNTSNVSYIRSIHCYADALRDGSRQYVYAVTHNDGLHHADVVTWPAFDTPLIGAELYTYDWFPFVKDIYMEVDFFDYAYPWAASDGNSFWYFTHDRAFEIGGGVRGIMQTWDDAIAWRDHLLQIQDPGSAIIIFDSHGMVIASTDPADAARLQACHASYVDSVVPGACIDPNASTYPTHDIRVVYNALHRPEWDDLAAPAVALAGSPLTLNGTTFTAVAGTLVAANRLRLTVVWYQPAATTVGDVRGISALICSLTLLSTVVLTILGVFGVLRPLTRLGQSMRAVATTLKDGPAGDDEGGAATATIQAHDRNIFLEVDNIGKDFETIVVDFLGFSSHGQRDNARAVRDASHPFAVVFTDVEASTALWGMDPIAMSHCMQTHHALIRRLAAEHHLYEVKTVGDSFVLVAACPRAALGFALAVQSDFVDHDWDWPEMDAYYETTHKDLEGYNNPDLWGGLRVRVGIHYGRGDIVLDAVTKGYDYYGPVVNTAARIEAAGHGGQILVSGNVLEALPSPLAPWDAIVVPLGVIPLRGVAEPPPVFQVLPARLAERRFAPPRADRSFEDRTPGHEEDGLPPVRSDRGSDANGSSSGQVGGGGSARKGVPAWTSLPEDLARGHSLVRSGTLTADVVAGHLRGVQGVIEDLLLPLAGPQRMAAVKTILKGWGVPPPRSLREVPTSSLHLALRMAETPKALALLQGTRRRHPSEAGENTLPPSRFSGDFRDASVTDADFETPLRRSLGAPAPARHPAVHPLGPQSVALQGLDAGPELSP